MTEEQTQQVAALNDRMRTLFEGGKPYVTQGVSALGTEFILGAMQKVVTFTDFTPANDPHKEHDFGKIEHEGETLFWKIDVFADAECMFGADEPWNPDCSYRVLTLMKADEY